MGNLAGFASPFLIGWMKDLTHSTDAGMFMLTGSLLVGAVLTLMVRPVDSIIADTVIKGSTQ
jgi:MFS-type transporter involved in bile tolerance (Atg22 family)